jgi:hypothetical protein
LITKSKVNKCFLEKKKFPVNKKKEIISIMGLGDMRGS